MGTSRLVSLVAAAVFVAGAASCSRTDGTQAAAGDVSAKTCAIDIDCGIGRFCGDDKVCAIDCGTAKDCAYVDGTGAPNVYDCSPCGRCLPTGTRDERCVLVSDKACDSDGDCTAAFGAAYVCGERKVCVRTCATDDDCKKQGRGWSCGDHICYRKCFRDLDCLWHGWHYECSLPAGVDKAVNAEAAAPVFGECLPREGGIDWGGQNDPDLPSYGYRGVWGIDLNAAVRLFGLPIVNSQDNVDIQYFLAKITQAGTGIAMELKFCTTELRNFNEYDKPFTNLAWIVVPDLYISNLPNLHFTVPDVPPLAPGASFRTSKALDVRGARLKAPERDPLPTPADLSTQYDQDRDGNPGMTLSVNGVLTGEIFTAQRWWTTNDVVAADRDHLQGLIDNGSEQSVLGATKPDLVYQPVTVKHPQADRSYWRLQRLADTATCDDVITLGKKTAGSWLEFEPHYDQAKKP